MVRTNRRLHPAGAAMHIVLAVVAVLMMLASAMVALSTMNLNLMTSFHNGQIAQNEAEAGVSRLLYAVAEKDTFGENQADEIRGCVTPGYADPETFHYVTFRLNSGFPYSVNNKSNGRPTGYLGRPVPPGMIHAFVTGQCRGQFRTIEVVLERPPFPFAVASSGRVVSSGPLVAQGTTGTGGFEAGDLTRPGNVASNSTSTDQNHPSIYIGRDEGHPDLQTLVTGFVQSAGVVKILDPATVRGGIRPTTDSLKLPEISFASLSVVDPDTGALKPGVVEISPATFGAQTLDVMYHCSHDLTYTSALNLENAFLYVKGSLTVQGGIKGSGAIVAEGDVTVQGDTSLEASNRVALVAGKRATLQGEGNYFQGLVYAGEAISASRITVLGNLVVNSKKDTTKGDMTLDRVRVVSNPEYADMTVTVTSSSDARSQQRGGDLPFRFNASGMNANEGEGWFSGDVCTVDNILTPFKNKTAEQLGNMAQGMKFDGMDGRRDLFPDGGGVFDAMDRARTNVTTQQSNLARINDLQSAIDAANKRPSPGNPPRPPVDVAAANEEIRQLTEANKALVAALPGLLRATAEAYVDYYKKHADEKGRYKGPGKTLDVKRDFTLSLNQFLPVSQRLKVKYWHVFHERL